jgi:CubicO group peptidase (beta-lactamase class C family)
MFSIKRMLTGLGLVGLVSTGLAQAPAIPAEVEIRINSRITNQYCPGFVVAMINTNGARFYSFGRAALDSSEPLNEDSLFEIGSITKTFTGTLLSDLVLNEGLGLAESVRSYLPSAVNMPTYNGDPITLQHLATHTSGLPFLPNNMEAGNSVAAFADYTVAGLYSFLSNYRLGRSPGAQWEYSDLGMGLLGHALSLQSGKDYESLVVGRIAQVLGMPDTRISLTSDQQRRLVKGYAGVAPRPYLAAPVLASCVSLRSTARDLITYLAANMGLSSSTLYPAMTNAHQPRFSAETLQMGLGWILSPTSSDQIIWHDGSTWGFYSFLGFLKNEKLGVVVLANSYLDISSTIGFHLLDTTIPLDSDPIPAAVPLANLHSCVGRYLFNANDFFDITFQNGHLTFVHTSDLGLNFTLYPSSPWTFFVQTPIMSATSAFQTNSQGQVTSMLWTQNGQSARYPKVPLPAQVSLVRRDGKTQLSFTGDSGVDYIVQASSDLVAWTPISTNTIWTQPVVDPASDQPRNRFYRLKKLQGP